MNLESIALELSGSTCTCGQILSKKVKLLFQNPDTIGQKSKHFPRLKCQNSAEFVTSNQMAQNSSEFSGHMCNVVDALLVQVGPG